MVLAGVILAGYFQHSIAIYVPDPEKLASYPQPTLLPLRINCFIAGMLLAHLAWQRKRDNVLLIALVISMFAFQRLTFSAIALGLMLLILARRSVWIDWTSASSWPLRVTTKFLSLPALKFLGDISFGVYLLHGLVLLPLVHSLNGLYWFSAQSGDIKFLIVSIVAVPPILLVSWAAHLWIERPMIERGRVLTKSHR